MAERAEFIDLSSSDWDGPGALAARVAKRVRDINDQQAGVQPPVPVVELLDDPAPFGAGVDAVARITTEEGGNAVSFDHPVFGQVSAEPGCSSQRPPITLQWGQLGRKRRRGLQVPPQVNAPVDPDAHSRVHFNGAAAGLLPRRRLPLSVDRANPRALNVAVPESSRAPVCGLADRTPVQQQHTQPAVPVPLLSWTSALPSDQDVELCFPEGRHVSNRGHSGEGHHADEEVARRLQVEEDSRLAEVLMQQAARERERTENADADTFERHLAMLEEMEQLHQAMARRRPRHFGHMVGMQRSPLTGSPTRPRSSFSAVRLRMGGYPVMHHMAPPEMFPPQAMAALARSGLPPHLLFSDRDFTADDYEFLCKLDENVENRRGADAQLISSLPEEVVPAGSVSPGVSTGRCVICLEDVVEGAVIRRLPCGHSFHRDCVDRWLKQKAVCPTCQQDCR